MKGLIYRGNIITLILLNINISLTDFNLALTTKGYLSG